MTDPDDDQSLTETLTEEPDDATASDRDKAETQAADADPWQDAGGGEG